MKVTLGQLGIHQGSIAESNLEAIDLSTFNAKANIKSAVSLVEEVTAALNDLEPGHAMKKLCRHLRRLVSSMPALPWWMWGPGQSILASAHLGHTP